MTNVNAGYFKVLNRILRKKERNNFEIGFHYPAELTDTPTFFFFIRALSMGAVTIPTGALYHRIYPIWADVADITTTGMK